MAKKPKKPCKNNSCPKLVRSGYCEEHAEDTDSSDRSKEAQERSKHYNTKRWQKIRKRVLRRDPMCQMCEEEPSEEVDHITPLSEGGTDSMENLQGLCTSCHSKKTYRENEQDQQTYDYPWRE